MLKNRGSKKKRKEIEACLDFLPFSKLITYCCSFESVLKIALVEN